MKSFLVVLVAALMGLAVALIFYLPERNSGAEEAGVSDYDEPLPPEAVSTDISGSRRTAIVVAAEKVGPAVVSISVIQTRVVTTARRSPFRHFRNSLTSPATIAISRIPLTSLHYSLYT